MELLLILVACGSLVLAVVMSRVAWRLLREDRSRSAARVAALETLASEEAVEDPAPAEPLVLRGAARRQPPSPRAGADEPWDLAFRPAPAVRESEPVPDPDIARTPAAVGDDLFGAAAGRPLRRPRQGLTAVLTAAAFVFVGVSAAYAVRSADRFADLTRRLVGSGAGHARPLELLSLRHTADPGGTFTVTGLVQNPPDGRPLAGVAAVVYLFDEEGRYFASGRAILEPASLHPGNESPFVVTIAGAASVSRYRVGFRFSDGGVVAHVDRRGALPGGTTGDAVNGVDRDPDREPARPARSEG
jgi:hypothetical protein